MSQNEAYLKYIGSYKNKTDKYYIFESLGFMNIRA
jgi:hypothetical protein